MQIRKEQLQRQQMIMQALGYYRHKCDGIWGPASIEAKSAWEMDKSFIPGLPNNGLPLGEDDLLPANVGYDAASRLFTHPELTKDKIQSMTNEVPVPDQAQKKEENVIPVPGAPATPAAEEVKEPVAEVATTDVGNPQQANNQQNRHHQNHRKNKRHGR